jgi:hypothetical protein
VNDQFISVVEQQHDDLQEIARTIRPQPQLTTWALLISVRQRVGDQLPLRRVDRVLIGHAMLARRTVDIHRAIVIRN